MNEHYKGCSQMAKKSDEIYYPSSGPTPLIAIAQPTEMKVKEQFELTLNSNLAHLEKFKITVSLKEFHAPVVTKSGLTYSTTLEMSDAGNKQLLVFMEGLDMPILRRVFSDRLLVCMDST